MPNPAPGFSKHPDHRVDLSARNHVVKVHLGGEIVADTKRAILLNEAGYPACYYVPITDVQMEKFSATEHATYCPFKGSARYWNVAVGAAEVENGAWGYDSPFDECAELAEHIAFYSQHFDIQTPSG